MTNKNMKWWVVDERVRCQLFIEALDATTKDEAIKAALRDLDRLTDGEKEDVVLFYVMLAEEDADGDPDFETVSDDHVLFRGGHPAAYIDGKEVNYDAAVDLMDDDIREELHLEMAPCTNQEFLDAYCKAHYNKYGIDFIV